MDTLTKEILKIIIPSVSTGTLILIFVFLNPEKVEIWASKFWKICRFLWKGAEKKYIAHDIQGHVNDFNRSLKKEIKNYTPIGVKIKWVEKNETESSFFKDNALIIRIRKSEDQNKNFVVAAMTFISRVLLRKAKRYISKKQRESIDLYAAKKLFEKEKPEILEHFLQSFLIAKTERDKKVAEYFDKYSIIDKVGLFFSVLIQELNFLGGKIFGKRRENIIIDEVNGLIDFLKNYSEREIGEERINKTFNGKYCHFGVMIVAKSWKVAKGDIKPFLRYIKRLLGSRIENIYIIGPSRKDNLEFIRNICSNAEGKFNIQYYFEKEYPANIIYNKDGKRKKVNNFLILLRSKDIKFHYDSEDHKSFTTIN